MDENRPLLDSPPSPPSSSTLSSPLSATKSSTVVLTVQNQQPNSDQASTMSNSSSSSSLTNFSSADEVQPKTLANAEDLHFRTACLLILVLIITDLALLSVNPALLRIEFHATWLQKTIILCSALAVLAYGLTEQLLLHCLKKVISRRVEQALDVLFFAVLYLAAIPSLVVIVAYELLYLLLQLGGYVPMASQRS